MLIVDRLLIKCAEIETVREMEVLNAKNGRPRLSISAVFDMSEVPVADAPDPDLSSNVLPPVPRALGRIINAIRDREIRSHADRVQYVCTR